MLYARYGAGAKDILSTEYKVGMDILLCAKRQKEEEMLFDRWIHSFSNVSFDEFKCNIGYNKPAKKEKSAEEIIEEVRNKMR